MQNSTYCVFPFIESSKTGKKKLYAQGFIQESGYWGRRQAAIGVRGVEGSASWSLATLYALPRDEGTGISLSGKCVTFHNKNSFIANKMALHINILINVCLIFYTTIMRKSELINWCIQMKNCFLKFCSWGRKNEVLKLFCGLSPIHLGRCWADRRWMHTGETDRWTKCQLSAHHTAATGTKKTDKPGSEIAILVNLYHVHRVGIEANNYRAALSHTNQNPKLT